MTHVDLIEKARQRLLHGPVCRLTSSQLLNYNTLERSMQ